MRLGRSFYVGLPPRAMVAVRWPICYPLVMGTRQKYPVTFVCEWCGKEVTEAHGPGQRPRYCRTGDDPCYPKAQRALNRKRVFAHRERQWLADPFTHPPPGRREPRKG
jgi:hypothetical protein